MSYYRLERTNDEGKTWTLVNTVHLDTTAAWDRYSDMSETERVRLVKDGKVISTSHVDDAL